MTVSLLAKGQNSLVIGTKYGLSSNNFNPSLFERKPFMDASFKAAL